MRWRKQSRSEVFSAGCCVFVVDYNNNKMRFRWAIAAAGIAIGAIATTLYMRKRQKSTSVSSRQTSSEFTIAASAVKSLTITDTNTQLQLYGLYKQVMFGDCTESAPLSPIERAKHAAWTKCKGMTQGQAEYEYIQTVSRINPGEEANPMGAVKMSQMAQSLEGRDEYETPLDDSEEKIAAIH
jgi:acyl-CoA-binding protein